MPVYPCPCCGRSDFGEPPGSFAICEVCSWEDCALQLSFPMMGGGPNRSLAEEQRNFAKRNSRLSLVDPEWRPLEPDVDVYLEWDSAEDHGIWRQYWAEGGTHERLYYWREDYWLRAMRKPS